MTKDNYKKLVRLREEKECAVRLANLAQDQADAAVLKANEAWDARTKALVALEKEEIRLEKKGLLLATD